MDERDRRGFTPAQVESIREGVRRREATRDRAGLRGLDRIEIEVIEGLEYRARNPAEPAEMRVGEPADRGGTGQGSSPLSHMLTGTASCLLNQFIRAAVADDLPVRFTGASVRGEFSRAAGGGFERISVEVRGEGALPEARARALLEQAERLCYIHVTLSQAIRMTTTLVLDGRECARSVTGPEESLPL
jgi:uncharacterized OsmC-like protein